MERPNRSRSPVAAPIRSSKTCAIATEGTREGGSFLLGNRSDGREIQEVAGTLIGGRSGSRRREWSPLVLQFLGLRKRPPDVGVREPRRPVPSTSAGAVSLEPTRERRTRVERDVSTAACASVLSAEELSQEEWRFEPATSGL